MISLNDSKKYMLITENIHQWIPNKIPVVNKNFLIKEAKNRTKKPAIADNSDTLFWTFYCILYGEQEYEIDHSFQTEKQFKIKCIEDLRKIKPSLKTFKLKLAAIEDQLLNSKKINIQALLGLALLFKKNILYVWNRKCFEFICSEENNIYIINNNNNEPVSYDTDTTKIKYYKENFLQIENIDKPLRAASGYSKEELLSMAQKLEVKNVNPKTTKNILYQEILQKI
jgi:hypothetical protein